MRRLADMTAAQKIEAFREITLKYNLFNPVQSFAPRLAFESAAVVRNAWREILCDERFRDNVSLYFHIPYCKGQRCSYCMYYSQVPDAAVVPDSYMQYLCDEFDYFLPVAENTPFRALYIGGGTPSLMTVEQMRILLQRINGVPFDEYAEKCVEQSFLTTDVHKLRALREFGINRLSFGVQSLEPTVLANVRRDPVDISVISATINHSKALGFREINVDLMIGLPGESTQGVTSAIRRLIESGVDCVTIYIFRHLKRHLTQEGAQVSNVLDEYNTVYIPEVLQAVRETVSACGWIDTVGDDYTEYQFFSSAEHLARYDLMGYRTQPDRAARNSIMGFGHAAYSYAQDFMRYENRKRAEIFDPNDRQYVFDLIGAMDRQRVFVLDRLANHGTVELGEFAGHFQRDFLSVFANEVAELNDLHRCVVEGGTFRLCGGDRVETSALCKFFWDPQYLESLE